MNYTVDFFNSQHFRKTTTTWYKYNHNSY